LEANENMKKIVMVCICTTLLLATPFTSMAASPNPHLPEHSKITPTPNGDPDGPLAGGLDDISDWGYLLTFIGSVLYIPGNLIALSYTISQQQGLLNLIRNLVFLYFSIYGIVAGLTEAFDIKDLDDDGR
jgi:hypothetical protein